MPTAELVGLLADPDSWWRETAQRLLFERQDRSVIERLRDDGQGTSDGPGAAACPLDPRSAGGARSRGDLAGSGRIRSRGFASKPFAWPKPGSAASRRFLTRLLPMTGDPDPMVRFQLAFSLGEANADPRVMAALASIAARDARSNWTRAAVLSSIAGRSLAFLGELASRTRFPRKPMLVGHGSTSWRSWLDRSETRSSRANCSTRWPMRMPALNR